MTRPSVSDVPNVALSINPVKQVVVVAAVLGSETAEVLATRSFITHGTRASDPGLQNLGALRDNHWLSRGPHLPHDYTTIIA